MDKFVHRLLYGELLERVEESHFKELHIQQGEDKNCVQVKLDGQPLALLKALATAIKNISGVMGVSTEFTLHLLDVICDTSDCEVQKCPSESHNYEQLKDIITNLERCMNKKDNEE